MSTELFITVETAVIALGTIGAVGIIVAILYLIDWNIGRAAARRQKDQLVGDDELVKHPPKPRG